MEEGKARSLISQYLDRLGAPEFPTTKINSDQSDVGQIIVIPSFEEERIYETLRSLFNCRKPRNPVKLILVINQSEKAGEKLTPGNLQSKTHVLKSLEFLPDWISLDLVEGIELPEKKAGVGLARKIGMDVACKYALQVGKPELPIVCLDADCLVEPGYLDEIEKHFEGNPGSPGASIYFEHPLDQENPNAIKLYELRLRYYLQSLRFAGFPYAFQTVGSCMVCGASHYAKQGGMNQRKAGEDFYFLHKIIPLGIFTEICSTKVIPSPRVSERVPFGTGRAMANHSSGSEDLKLYYDLQTALDLKSVLEKVDLYINDLQSLTEAWEQFPVSFRSFTKQEDWEEQVNQIFSHAKSKKTRLKRFYSWLDGFRVLKFKHHSRDMHYPNSDLIENSVRLLELLNVPVKGNDLSTVLKSYRELERTPWTSPLDKLGDI